jgi:hypothetical protein
MDQTRLTALNSVARLCLAIILFSSALPATAANKTTLSTSPGGKNQKHPAHRQVRSAKRATQVKSGIPLFRPLAYPRTNFLHYGYPARTASRIQEPASSRKPGTTSNGTVKSEKTAGRPADKTSCKHSSKPPPLTESQNSRAASAAKAPQADDCKTQLLPSSTKDKKAAAALLPAAAPLPVPEKEAQKRENSLVSSIMDKMPASKTLSFNWTFLRVSPVSLIILLTVACFWLTMIYKGISGSRSGGLRSGKSASGDPGGDS